MRLLQAYLSGFFNLLYRNAQEPDRLWPWSELAVASGLLAGLVWVMVQLA